MDRIIVLPEYAAETRMRTELALGGYFVAASTRMPVASLEFPRYPAALEIMGGSLFVAWLVFASAILTLPC
jgi:hypothetical protein